MKFSYFAHPNPDQTKRSVERTDWIWYFILYSILGWGLETVYARLTGSQKGRKCTLVLPLCPVYGLGACAILALSAWTRGRPVLLAVLGALAATAVEYGMAVVYEQALGVAFWDYRGLPGNLQGRVCLPFTLAWGILSFVLVYVVHPLMARIVSALPTGVGILACLTVGTDLLISAWLLRQTGDPACLRWWVKG